MQTNHYTQTRRNIANCSTPTEQQSKKYSTKTSTYKKQTNKQTNKGSG
jgi:flagellar basal body rod protein FlgC